MNSGWSGTFLPDQSEKSRAIRREGQSWEHCLLPPDQRSINRGLNHVRLVSSSPTITGIARATHALDKLGQIVSIGSTCTRPLIRVSITATKHDETVYVCVAEEPARARGAGKGGSMKKLAGWLTAIAVCGGMLQGAPARGQDPTPPATAAAPDQQLLKSEELDQLVAPIALYPDPLLAEVLMASTYPLEVVQADRWATENKHLKGEALKAAVDKQNWDDSLKALVATPSVLAMMSAKLDWTQRLGDAVLAQQADVMDAIQRLRARAQAENKLKTTKQQIVTVKQEESKQVIVIQPANPDTLYVPYYNPSVVFGTWPYPAYPPYYFPAPGYVAGAVLATGLAFGAAYALGRWAGGGGYWGGGFNWGGNNINVNRSVNVNNRVNAWQHNSAHRRGVAYNNTNVRQQFGNNNIRSGNQGRMDFRGRGGQQVLRPGGGERGNLGGQRGNIGDRGNLGGQRGNIGDRGNRPNVGGGAGGNRANPGGGAGGRVGGGGGA